MVDDEEISSTNESSLKKRQLMVDDKKISSTLLQNSLCHTYWRLRRFPASHEDKYRDKINKYSKPTFSEWN